MLAVCTKLFTYEFFLPDDPTVGIALRFPPAWVSFQTLVVSPEGADLVLLEDENSFIGSGPYRALVGWGWLLLLVPWPALWAAGLGRRRAAEQAQPPASPGD